MFIDMQALVSVKNVHQFISRKAKTILLPRWCLIPAYCSWVLRWLQDRYLENCPNGQEASHYVIQWLLEQFQMMDWTKFSVWAAPKITWQVHKCDSYELQHCHCTTFENRPAKSNTSLAKRWSVTACINIISTANDAVHVLLTQALCMNADAISIGQGTKGRKRILQVLQVWYLCLEAQSPWPQSLWWSGKRFIFMAEPLNLVSGDLDSIQKWDCEPSHHVTFTRP